MPNLMYFELSGNESFFVQRVTDRGLQMLIAHSPEGIAGLAEFRDLFLALEDMRDQRMMDFSVRMAVPEETSLEKLIAIGVLPQTLTDYILKMEHVREGDEFLCEIADGKYYIISRPAASDRSIGMQQSPKTYYKKTGSSLCCIWEGISSF